MSVVTTRIFPQGRQWCVGEYGTQVTADHTTGKALGASTRQRGIQRPISTLFNSVRLICTNHYVLCHPQKKYVPCETAFRELTTWSRDLREKISVLGYERRNGLQWLRTYWITSRGQVKRGGPPAWVLGEVLTTPHRKKLSMLRDISQSLELMDTSIYYYVYIYTSSNSWCTKHIY